VLESLRRARNATMADVVRVRSGKYSPSETARMAPLASCSEDR
jgi:hypothetical protein